MIIESSSRANSQIVRWIQVNISGYQPVSLVSFLVSSKSVRRKTPLCELSIPASVYDLLMEVTALRILLEFISTATILDTVGPTDIRQCWVSVCESCKMHRKKTTHNSSVKNTVKAELWKYVFWYIHPSIFVYLLCQVSRRQPVGIDRALGSALGRACDIYDEECVLSSSLPRLKLIYPIALKSTYPPNVTMSIGTS